MSPHTIRNHPNATRATAWPDAGGTRQKTGRKISLAMSRMEISSQTTEEEKVLLEDGSSHR